MSTEADEGMSASELILYRTADARTRIEVRLEGGLVWLTQRQMAALFQVSHKTVSEHLLNIHEDGPCNSERTVRRFRTVATSQRPLRLASGTCKVPQAQP